MSELRDQHKAFTHWYFGLRGINEANFSPEDLAWAAWKAALAQPETEPEPVAWQVRWIDPEEGPGAWRICLDPSEADYYANREDHDWRPLYTHPPRDGWRPASELPTESPIAAKCQRIEGSGEICGLTPPCPDCGSSLIDVPEGSL